MSEAGKRARALIEKARENGSTFRCPCCENELVMAYSVDMPRDRGQEVAIAIRERQLWLTPIEEMEDWLRENRVEVIPIAGVDEEEIK